MNTAFKKHLNRWRNLFSYCPSIATALCVFSFVFYMLSHIHFRISRFWCKGYADCLRRKRKVGTCSLVDIPTLNKFFSQHSKQHTKNKFNTHKAVFPPIFFRTNNTTQSSSILNSTQPQQKKDRYTKHSWLKRFNYGVVEKRAVTRLTDKRHCWEIPVFYS